MESVHDQMKFTTMIYTNTSKLNKLQIRQVKYERCLQTLNNGLSNIH